MDAEIRMKCYIGSGTGTKPRRFTCYRGDRVGYTDECMKAYDEYRQVALDVLKSYEDTSYTPEEIAGLKAEYRVGVNAGADAIRQLKSENERLRAERTKFEYTHEEMTYIIQKAAHRRCDYCTYKAEPCPARGLNAECDFEYAGLEESTCG